MSPLWSGLKSRRPSQHHPALTIQKKLCPSVWRWQALNSISTFFFSQRKRKKSMPTGKEKRHHHHHRERRDLKIVLSLPDQRLSTFLSSRHHKAFSFLFFTMRHFLMSFFLFPLPRKAEKEQLRIEIDWRKIKELLLCLSRSLFLSFSLFHFSSSVLEP